jgi:hypothetical protein
VSEVMGTLAVKKRWHDAHLIRRTTDLILRWASVPPFGQTLRGIDPRGSFPEWETSINFSLPLQSGRLTTVEFGSPRDYWG